MFKESSGARLRKPFGLALCFLLCLFAVASKAALYHPQEQTAKALTSTKIWQDNQAGAVAGPAFDFEGGHDPAIFSPVLLSILLVLVSELFTARLQLLENRPAAASSQWFSPQLDLRPPPAL